MNIRITLTADEIALMRTALGCMDDNEHDKGAPDGAGAIWQTDVFDEGFALFETLLAARTDETPAPVEMNASLFGLICDAVEIYFTDPADDEDEYAPAQRALAARLFALPTITV